MKKGNLWVVALSLAIALTASVLQGVLGGADRLDGLAAVAAADSGKTWVARYEGSRIAFYLLGANGAGQDRFTVPRNSGADTAQIAHMTVDAQGTLYFIKDYTGMYDGKYSGRQELVLYTPKFLPFGRLRTIRPDTAGDLGSIRYLHIHVSTSVVLTGVSDDSASIIRKTYDTDSLKGSGVPAVKNIRTYPANPEEGVYRAAPSGGDVSYISNTGMVFFSRENEAAPTRIYPDAQAEYASYASFIHEATPGYVIIGEQNSGNILRLSDMGAVEYIAEGARAFGGLQYTGRNVLEMSFPPEDDSSWAAVVQNSGTGAFEIVVNDRGDIGLITRINRGFFTAVVQTIGRALIYFTLILALIGLPFGVKQLFTGSRTIFIKLISVSIPLLILALVLFGAYSYTAYNSSLRGIYETKAADQGNLLRALFSGATFDKITSPAMYTSMEYNYLRTQMGTRDVYTSSAYYVDGRLYTGIDNSLPLLYHFGIRYSANAVELYRAAALTGAQQTGIISDRFGERIVCITPVGSSSGNVVFLLETGIFQAEIDLQASGFIRNYLIISAVCLVGACVLLLAAFTRILGPLAGIIEGLDQFSKGNREVRLESKTNDELADITRVFNKMARDIDVQIYNLRTMGETYYRFVPQQIFRLLGKENLADVELGSAVEGKYPVLAANLYLRQGRMPFESIQGLTNRFFGIVHKAAGENAAMLLPNSVGLRDLRIICGDGAGAVKTAMEAIAGIDEYNAGAPIENRLEVSFFLHYTQMGFGICGDGERYIPAIISGELDSMLERCEDIRRLGSRLIVTEAAYGAVGAEDYNHRFIGYAGEDEESADRQGLYDFYDSSSPSTIRLLDDTLGAFNKAMELYGQKRYYDAKNMFTVVLRENQYDNVARHYIFRCERSLQNNSSERAAMV